MSGEQLLSSAGTRLTGLQAWSQFSQSIGFEGELWVKASWDLDTPPPENWPKKKDGSAVHRVFTGLATPADTAIQECRFADRDAQGNSKWEPVGEALNFSFLRSLSDAGATVHFYPCQPHGGLSNSHVLQSQLCFYEIDNKPIEAQWEVLQRLQTQTGLQPCVVVHTGGKSLHVYFRLSEPVAAHKWVVLNRKLAIVAGGDPNICNPARAMRLPGMARRLSNGEWAEVSLGLASKVTYTAEEFERRLDSTGSVPCELTQERSLQWRNSKTLAEVDSVKNGSPRKRAGIQTRLPAALYEYYGQHLIVWLWARALDDSWDNHGENLGQGRATFRLSALTAATNRSVSTVRRWLAGARDKGLIWRFQCVGDICRFGTVAWSESRLASVSPIWEPSPGLKFLILLTCESARLKSSRRVCSVNPFGTRSEAAKKLYGIKDPQIPAPHQLFSSPCEHLARVVGRSSRFLFVSEGFLPYGASQETVATVRGVSRRTIRRHLSDSYRLQPSPVRGYRSDLDDCPKVQVAQRVSRSYPVESLKSCRLEDLQEEGDRFILGPGNRWFFLRCNLYWLERGLSRIRFRRKHLQKLTVTGALTVSEFESRFRAREYVSTKWVEWAKKNAGLLAARYSERFKPLNSLFNA